MTPSHCPDCRSPHTAIRAKYAAHDPMHKYWRTVWILCDCKCGARWQQARLRFGVVVSGSLAGGPRRVRRASYVKRLA